MIQPPHLSRRFLEWIVEPEERPFLLADLDEEFRERTDTAGPRAARRWYRSQVLRSAIPSAVRRFRRRSATRSRNPRYVALAGVGHDVRYSVRRILSAPVYSLVVLFTLTLGIGALTSVFAVVNAVLIESMPFPEPDDLVLVNEIDEERGGAISWASPPNFLDWRSQADAFVHVAAMTPGTFVLMGDTRGERINGLHVSSNFFQVLGVMPEQGRSLMLEDEREGAEPVVVVSHGFWLRRFGDVPFDGGRTILLDDVSHRIIGVLPEHFRYLEPMDLWVPLQFGSDDRADGMRGARYLNVLGRISAGVSIATASERFAELAEQLQIHPNNRGWSVALTPLRESVVRGVRPALLLLFGAVIFILLIVCANVATLVMSRTTGAWREFALRRALGATGARIFRQVAIEHALLSLAGATLGAMLASVSLDSLLQLMPNSLPGHADVGVGGGTAGVAFLVALITALGLSGASLAAVTRSSPSQFLRSSAATGQNQAVHFIRNTLIVGEIALSIVLLIGAVLMVRSFTQLRNVDIGFVADRVLTAPVTLPSARYGTSTAKAGLAERLMNGLSGRTGVQLAALTTNLPMSGSSMKFQYHADEVSSSDDERLSAQYHAVSRDYFAATGIPFRFGATFPPDGDRRSTVIVNETLARRIWGDVNPMGRRITVVSQNGPLSREVVGVIADVRHTDPTTGAAEEVYVPFEQDPWSFFTIVVKADAGVPLAAAATAIREGVTSLDPAMAAPTVTPLEEVVARWSAPLRFQMTLVGLFAIMALGLAAIGIYGVVAYFVGSRVREFGVRIAVGAGKRDILGLVVLRSLGVALLGVAIGVVLSSLLTRVLRSVLFEVSPHDVPTYVFVSALMLVVAVVASFVPAKRATDIDPVDALRAS